MTTNESTPGLDGAEGAEDEQAGGRVVMSSVPDQHAEELLTLGVALGELLDDLDGQHAREAAEFRAGYDLGFAAGREVGHAQAETDMERAWTPVAESVRRLGRTLTREEIERRRWDGRREDFGKPRPGDYMGGAVEWETGRPIERRTVA